MIWVKLPKKAEMVVMVEGDSGGTDRLEGKGSGGADGKIDLPVVLLRRGSMKMVMEDNAFNEVSYGNLEVYANN